MREFSEAEWRNDPTTVAAAANDALVVLLNDGQARHVLMTIERYRRMQRSDPRPVYRTDNIPPEIAAEILTAIDAFLGDDVEHEADDHRA
ncbi:hypothetical protein [Zavarzinia aquatilis]|uniref:Prevent-host-death protein n=1 Tax=Zavarzinia aquatilis TaxID=2211142 RepID=A0A317DY75_9PROT|nr:hypothetical protein [Zavarzinia aquatilis]PWR17943.1 hypothetical protein DKG74_20270 [Zavarzinia aquatilis]